MTGALELQPSGSGSDGELAIAAAEGDRHAFAEIYDRYADRLYDFCVGLLGDRDAAADCVQDAFCVAATDLGGLREPDKLRPWLYSIARNHAMRRLRHRYCEEVSDEVPDMVSHEASPETLAGQSELARLVAEAAGGLSDCDRELLELSYRHGLDGPELAEALGVTLTSANTKMFRLRQTVERCLGALLVARAARANPHACPELTTILKGWDGQFTVLMRKRMVRHIDSCDTCDQDRRRHVNPVALLGGAPVFIPAPGWLRRQTLDRVQLTSASSSMTEASSLPAGSSTTETAGTSTRSGETSGKPTGSRQIDKRRMAIVVGIPVLFLTLSVPWLARQDHPVNQVVDISTDAHEVPLPVAPAAIKGPPTPARPQAVPPAGTVHPSVPTRQPEANPGADAPSPAPEIVVPDPGPTVTFPAPRIDSEPIPNPNITTNAQIATAPVTNPRDTTPQGNTAPQDDTASIPDPEDSTTDTQAKKPAVTNPKDTTNPQGTTGSFGTIPNPNLNTKVASPYPKTNTATITNPKATTPDLQINNTAPKPITPPKTNKAITPPKTNATPKSGTNPKGTTSGTN